MARQSGFTLIELVMVIVILGILAASAIPKFVDVSGDARQSAVSGIAGALGSASAINYAVKRMNASNGVYVDNCTDVANALETPLDATKYQIESLAMTNATETCTLKSMEGTETATFIGHHFATPAP